MGAVHELNPLALAQLRVKNALGGLDQTERLVVLGHAVARILLRSRDPKWASVDFLQQLWGEMDILAPPAEPPTQE